ncbi:MAG: DPP IV N-terminal domain-containing protein [Chloroflexota bacterium]
MLLRLYRVTDKFGVIVLKIVAEFTQYLAEGVHLAFGGAQGGLLGLIIMLWGVVLALFRWLRRGFALLLQLMGIAARGTSKVASRGAKGATAGASSARQAMVQRAERSAAQQEARQEIEVGMVEDPLRVQNRALSMVVVLMGFVLLGAIIWATSSTRQPASGAVSVAAAPNAEDVSFAAGGPATPTIASIVNTPIPTATAIPAVLEVRGSIAYTAYEKGQQDIWVVEVGSTNPIRLTNDPQDERDPAWSPDGRRLAYAARRDGNWEIYVYDVQTEQTTRLTYDLAFQANPSWSPDGAFVVYESYQGNNLDLYIVPIDGSELPIRLTDNPAADFAPAWSPDGRRIAFSSWRTGNQEIFVISLDDPRDAAAINITNTLERHEDYPAWSPDGSGIIAFSALDEGIEKIFVKSADEPTAPAQALERGKTPAWSPDGASMVFTVDSIDNTHIVASPFTQGGVATEIIPVLPGSSSPSWTAAPLPPSLANSEGVGPAIGGNLYEEQSVRFDADPPFRLDSLVNVDAPNAVMHDAVNDSFNAMRETANERVGFDFLGELEDAFWRIDRPPQPGEERRNWHMTGRAFSINRNLIAGFPPPIEIVREDIGVNTYWHVYVRVSEGAQNGQLGEPLRDMPWDFASRAQGDVQAYDEGGRLRDEMPEGYYIDLTQLALDYGWERLPAGRDWRANYNSTNFWLFHKPDGLTWYEAMRELYTEAQLGGFVPTATPIPGLPVTEQPDEADES